MAAQSLPAGVLPSRGSRLEERAHVVEASFGDGYAQRAAAGLNSVRRSYSAAFVGLPDAGADGADALLALFRRWAGVTPFSFTPPGGTAGMWVCGRWSRERLGAGRSTVRAAFTEDFA